MVFPLSVTACAPDCSRITFSALCLFSLGYFSVEKLRITNDSSPRMMTSPTLPISNKVTLCCPVVLIQIQIQRSRVQALGQRSFTSDQRVHRSSIPSIKSAVQIWSTVEMYKYIQTAHQTNSKPKAKGASDYI